MRTTKGVLSDEINAYQVRLDELAASLAWCKRWGIAGFPEGVYTMLLGETLRQLGWRITYEPSYRTHLGTQDFTRGDLLAERDGRELWVEARWWWKEKRITPILTSFEAKLKRAIDPRIAVAALVLTVGAKPGADGVNVPEAWKWSKEPKREMREVLGADLLKTWEFWGCAISDSYFDVGSENDPMPTEGHVAAAFYGLRR
jgi:hypothetical protein